MKKLNSIICLGLLAFTCGTMGLSSSFANDSSSNNSNNSPAYHHHKDPFSVLSSDEKDEFLKARYQVLATSTSLRKEDEKLHDEGFHKKHSEMSQSDIDAMHEKWGKHEDKMRDAMLKADPSLDKIFAKLDKEHSKMDKCCAAKKS